MPEILASTLVVPAITAMALILLIAVVAVAILVLWFGV